jgi:hypothetical protein
MNVKALVNVDKPLIIICAVDASPDEYAEIEFETQEDANAAVEGLNQILKSAKGITFRRERGEAHLEG